MTLSHPGRFGLAWALCLAAWAGARAEAPPLSPTADLDALLSEVRRVNRGDYLAWRRFAFRRSVARERLDQESETVSREDLVFRVTPEAEGFDELLLSVDGRDPRRGEIQSHRRAARFTRHYRTLSSDEDVDPSEGFSLPTLLALPRYRDMGIEQVDAVACRRLDFEPLGAGDPHGVPQRFAEVMAGSLWISLEGSHLVRIEARTVRPVPLAFGLIRVLGLRVAGSGSAVAEGIWLPRELEVESNLRILGKRLRKRNTFHYDQYLAVDAGRQQRRRDRVGKESQ